MRPIGGLRSCAVNQPKRGRKVSLTRATNWDRESSARSFDLAIE